MNNPRDICLESDGGDTQKRREVYGLIHIANVIRKNIHLIAPDVDPKGFTNFVHGPNKKTRDAMIVAIGQLPKTVMKSVVSCLGKYHVEDKSNINYSRKFEQIFRRNGEMGSYAADFFMKNLTTARCNGIVFIMQPYLVLRYDLKHRSSWFDRCRFIWMGCALFRLPSLLPVLAAQIFLYTIKLFIQQPSLTRKEELLILSELANFLPGLVSVAKPPFGVGLSVYYRDMARHRRIVLEAILNEAKNDGQLQYYVAPYSMISFESMDEVISFIEEELKYCDKEETMEKKDRKRTNARKDRFDDDSELDEEDRELLQLGGYRIDEDEDMEEGELEEEEVEMEDNVECDGVVGIEETVEYEEVVEEETDDDEEEYSEAHVRIFQNMENGSDSSSGEEEDDERDGSITEDSVPVEYPCHNIEPLKKIRRNDMLISANGRKRSIDSGYEKDDDEEISPSKRSGLVEDGMIPLKKCGIIDEGVPIEEEDKEEEARNEDAIKDIFDSIPAGSEYFADNCSGWDPSMVLSTQEITRGLDEESTLLTGDSQTIGSSMNLIIPMADVAIETNDDNSSTSLPCPLETPVDDAELSGNVSPPTNRSDEDSLNDDSGLEELNESFGNRYIISLEDHHLPPPHIPRAPTKKMKEKDDFIDEDDVDWVETKIIESDEIQFLEEKVGPNGGRGPQRRDVKRELISPK